MQRRKTKREGDTPGNTSANTPAKSAHPVALLFRGILYVSVPALLGLAAFIYLKGVFLDPPDPDDSSIVLFEIPPTTSIREIGIRLQERGLLKKWWAFYYLTRATKKDRKITAGEFELTRSMNVPELLEKLESGDTFKRKVTIKEGALAKEVPLLFEKAELIPAKLLATTFENSAFFRSLGLPSEATSIEGYVFPETYFFSRPLLPEAAVRALVEQGKKVWTPEMESQLSQLALSRHQIVTLASIIEKESGNAREQPLIASVFHNRLSIGMRLQSDPTVIYGLSSFDGNLTRAHLETPNPYNTYTNSGLPPGPICNPGLTALKAALSPETSTFLYFVADGSGGHVFSSTLSDHNKAVAKYQKLQR